MTRYTKFGNRRETKMPSSSLFEEANKTGSYVASSSSSSFKTGTRSARSEHNKRRRQRLKYSKSICFKCRETGHSASTCPTGNSSKSGNEMGICFHCGEKSHKSNECNSPSLNGSWSFASCFVCGQKGHLASNCSKNPNGLYPNGGGCRICGDNTHLVKNCTVKGKSEEIKNGMSIGIREANDDGGADEDDFHLVSSELLAESKVKKELKPLKKTNKKIISF